MSMREYPVNIEAAFFLDQRIAAYIMKDNAPELLPGYLNKMPREEFDLFMLRADPRDLDDVDPQLLEDMDLDGVEVGFCNNFDGEVSSLRPEFCEHMTDITCDEGYVNYILADKGGDPFSQAYASEEELLAEFQKKLMPLGVPGDFDWWANIVYISGTTFG